MSRIENDGILISDAKAAIEDKTVFASLCEIKESYIFFVENLDNFESSKYDIENGYRVLSELNIANDVVNIKQYINNRLKVNDIQDIVTLKNENISPACYVAYKKCPPTSISVERSFSMLKKILGKDRNFLPENVKKYMSLYYNSKVLNENVCEFDDFMNERVFSIIKQRFI